MAQTERDASLRQSSDGSQGLRYWWPVLALAAILVVYAGFVGALWKIQTDAHAFGQRAMHEFAGDEVEALIAFVHSDAHPLIERNRAVNALGQLGDPRALKPLQELYTGLKCEHDKFLCQLELGKAIEKCSGKGRAPRWLPFLPPRK